MNIIMLMKKCIPLMETIRVDFSLNFSMKILVNGDIRNHLFFSFGFYKSIWFDDKYENINLGKVFSIFETTKYFKKANLL